MTSTSRFSAVPALFATALVLAGCGGIGADGRFREDPIGDIEQQLIGNTLAGIGLIPRQRERIDYSPRAPLAMPPRGQAGQLRSPEDRTDITASAANWPRDPDEMRRQREQREAGRARDFNWERERDGRRLTIEEMEAQRHIGPDGTRAAGGDRPFQERNVILGRDELERGWEQPSGDGLFRVDETVDATQDRGEGRGAARREIDRQASGIGSAVGGRQLSRIDTTRVGDTPEPPRRLITDPPPGFRTPAADPTGGVVTEEDRANRPLWERLFGR